MATRTSTNKRGNREGSIFQRADGRWCGQIPLPGDSRAKRRRKSIYGRTREEVRRKMLEAQNTLQNGYELPAERMTVADFIPVWLGNVQASIRFKTLETYESVLRSHVVPHVGTVPLARLNPTHVQRMYNQLLDEGLSASSVAKLHTVLHNMLGKAVRLGMTNRNVTELVDVPRPKHREKVMLSPGEVHKLLDAARGHRFEALFTLAVTTGARSGELLGLSWEDVDLDQGTLNIRRSLQKLKEGYGLGDPKTKRSRRQIALPTVTIRALRSHRLRQTEESLRIGAAWSHELNLVFTTRSGTKLSSNNILNREFRPLLKQADLPVTLRFHDLRDIAASLLLASEPITDVSDMLGHADPSITMKVYAHALPGAPRRMADAMDKLLGA